MKSVIVYPHSVHYIQTYTNLPSLREISIEQVENYIRLAEKEISKHRFTRARRFLSLAIEWCEGLEKRNNH